MEAFAISLRGGDVAKELTVLRGEDRAVLITQITLAQYDGARSNHKQRDGEDARKDTSGAGERICVMLVGSAGSSELDSDEDEQESGHNGLGASPAAPRVLESCIAVLIPGVCESVSLHVYVAKQGMEIRAHGSRKATVSVTGNALPLPESYDSDADADYDPEAEEVIGDEDLEDEPPQLVPAATATLARTDTRKRPAIPDPEELAAEVLARKKANKAGEVAMRKDPKPELVPKNKVEKKTDPKSVAVPVEQSGKKPVAKLPKVEDGERDLKELPLGLKYRDFVVGSGQRPRRGREVHVSYTLRLPNGKKVDASGNKGFTFRFGIGQVIRGWDLGIASMREGGERFLQVPPELGYGKKGAPPDIPGNSVLMFDVKLLRAG
ncbi:FK506-binding protein 4 [Porphyridium purpureum]|uniref:peptidylprolyl isomerase n=1 Tax=Porphyridium purpureum TaxID=35688 RepID=A0A5J4YV90_PORPP|nr:FK506-binding protein 4 [Porphyridium purpureum]|eukprot:POR0130..scf209_3